MATKRQNPDNAHVAHIRAAVRLRCLEDFAESVGMLREMLSDSRATNGDKLKALDFLAKHSGLLAAEPDLPEVKTLDLRGLSQSALDELDRLALGLDD